MSMSGHNRNGYHNSTPTTSRAAMAMSMIAKCSLDSDQCCNLLQILDSFHTAINEEQAWSICYQCVVAFNQHYHPCQSYLITDPQHIVIHKDGYVHQKTLQLCSSDDTTRPLATSHNKLIKSLGVVLFHALDYGLCEDEERTLSKPLENLIEKLTSVGHRKRPTRTDNSSDGHSDDDYDDNDDDFAKDEGIERDCHDDSDAQLTHTISFDLIIQMCISRLSCRESAESHYKAVCRALVAEALELSTFLDQIANGTKELRKSSVRVIGSSHTNELEANLDGLQFHDWARLWIQVICELRHGVKLKKVDHDSLHHLEFELTPYEMLLDDIRSRRYKLNKVMINGDLPQRVKKDAHALILDFIRSRPPLVPVSKRVLAPPPPKQVTLYDKLMQSIRQQHKLRPTPPSSAHVTPTHTPNNTMINTVETSRTKLTDTEMTPQPRRRLIKADLTLHLSNSFDDDDEDNNRNLTALQWCSMPKSTSLADDDNVFSEPQEKQISLPCQDNRVEQQEQEQQLAEKKSRRFSLKNLSLRLLSHERRHSITVCESPNNRKSISDEITDLDVNEDTRQHVASIWESTDWGRALECLSLTLQEVQHIRSVLTKAEIETLAVTKSLRDDLENGKICFTCLKTRFSFWGPWPTICKLCERAICERCSTKMHIPTEHFDKVPIYMLSPTPSPPADGDDKTKWLQTTTTTAQHVSYSNEEETKSLPQMDVSRKKKSRLMRVFTRDKDIVLYDSSNKKSGLSNGPLVRVCRDCKILVRHLIDIGHTNFDSSKCVISGQTTTTTATST